MKDYLLLALIGKSGAGKDTLMRSTCEAEEICNRVITHTTRPMRDTDKDGEDYHFISFEEFIRRLIDGRFIEASYFNQNWFYGTDISSLRKNEINIGVFNPNSMPQLFAHKDIEVIPIYITADSQDRLIRSLEREAHPNCAEICRRFLADEEDFSLLPFDYVLIDNSNATWYDGCFNLLKRKEVVEAIRCTEKGQKLLNQYS